jgi:hypothetical protein
MRHSGVAHSSMPVPSCDGSAAVGHRRRRRGGARVPADRVREHHVGYRRASGPVRGRAAYRDAALAHFIASYGNLQNPVDRLLNHYYAHCAITASCRDLALAGLFFPSTD